MKKLTKSVLTLAVLTSVSYTPAMAQSYLGSGNGSSFSSGLTGGFGNGFNIQPLGQDNAAIGYPEFNAGAGAMTNTPTRHHRWGRETGIGSSNSQTTAATADSTREVQYTPTSVSPALTPIRSNLTLQGSGLFSSRMSSPALTQPVTAPPDFELGQKINASAFEGALPSRLSGQSYSLFNSSGLNLGLDGSTSDSGISAPALSKPGEF